MAETSIDVLREAVGKVVTIEKISGNFYCGTLVEVQESTICQLRGVTATFQDGSTQTFELSLFPVSQIFAIYIGCSDVRPANPAASTSNQETLPPETSALTQIARRLSTPQPQAKSFIEKYDKHIAVAYVVVFVLGAFFLLKNANPDKRAELLCGWATISSLIFLLFALMSIGGDRAKYGLPITPAEFRRRLQCHL